MYNQIVLHRAKKKFINVYKKYLYISHIFWWINQSWTIYLTQMRLYFGCPHMSLESRFNSWISKIQKFSMSFYFCIIYSLLIFNLNIIYNKSQLKYLNNSFINYRKIFLNTMVTLILNISLCINILERYDELQKHLYYLSWVSNGKTEKIEFNRYSRWSYFSLYSQMDQRIQCCLMHRNEGKKFHKVFMFLHINSRRTTFPSLETPITLRISIL